jgi:replicative DNA helicase
MTALNKLSQYGSSFQVKVLSSLLKHKEFLQNIHDVLDPDFFDNPAHKWLVEEILRYYHKYHTVATLDSLHIEVKKIDNEVLKVSVIEQLKEAFKTVNEDQDYIEQEFANFCKNQQLKKALLTSVDLLGSGMYDDIRTIIDSALKSGQDKNIGHEYEKDIESRYRHEERGAISTGWDKIDELLQGGLGSGDFGIIFGNPGGGKSWCLTAIGATAVKLGYNVLHYTLELSESYVAKRYDAVFSETPIEKLESNRENLNEVINNLPGTLIIKEYTPGRASISTIETHIQKCTDLGTKPDLIIIDYVDLLKSKRKSVDKKDEIDDVYTASKGLARELKVPVWTVSQVNRAGAKDDIIEGDKAAGSYDKIMIADFALSLSRKRQDKVSGTGRFHVMKNRYGMDGMSYEAIIDTNIGKIIIDSNEFDESNIVQGSENMSGGKINNFNRDERDLLSKKFFELGGLQ